MDDKKYIKRLIETDFDIKMHSSGCVLVCGPKFCGKTKMCEQYAKSKIKLNSLTEIEKVSADLQLALDGEYPHLIDEWQKVPEIWNKIKSDLDDKYIFGKYILTGSTTPINSNVIQHSGAGRITRMLLKPFSLYESGESNGIVSLKEIFNKNFILKRMSEDDNKISLSDIAYLMCRGGWPISVLSEKKYALNSTINYYNSLFINEGENDEVKMFLKNKDVGLLKIILKSFARNISTQCKKSVMIRDIIESGIRTTLSEDTFNVYEKILKDLFIIYDLPAWNLNLRSTVSVRSAPTHHFVDTSIALAALEINPNDLINDIHSFGYFFEDFAIRDISVYTQANCATLKHYRDSSGQEVDLIVELPNGDYGAIEIKIASKNNIDSAIKSLRSFENKLIKSKSKLPAFKMVLTSHGACYKKDDIYIVPISCLKD